MRSATRITDAEVDELLWAWRRVIAWARERASRQELGFVLAVQRDSNKPGWRPSHRQFSFMRRLKARADREAPAMDELDFPGPLIEESPP